MKLRIQLDATFNDTDANNLLNEIENMKTLVYNNINTLIPIERIGEQYVAYSEENNMSPTLLESVDFDISSTTYSTIEPSGIRVKIDLSCSIEQDTYDLVNYIESVKSLALTDYPRFCRFFECNHETNPLIHDGPYTHINFDGPQLTHPV